MQIYCRSGFTTSLSPEKWCGMSRQEVVGAVKDESQLDNKGGEIVVSEKSQSKKECSMECLGQPGEAVRFPMSLK